MIDSLLTFLFFCRKIHAILIQRRNCRAKNMLDNIVFGKND